MLGLQWSIPADGFEWVDGRVIDGLVFPGVGHTGIARKMRVLVPVPTSRPPRSIDVFEHRALFRAFARLGRVNSRGQLELEEEDVLAFANRYGWLGAPWSENIVDPHPVDPKAASYSHGEQLLWWHKQVAFMRHGVIDLWDNARTRRADKLKKFIGWDGIRVIHKFAGISKDVYHRLDRPDGAPFPQLARGDYVAAGWLALLKFINEQLRVHSLHALVVDQSRAGETAASFTVQADSMIAALWTQFARAVADNPTFRQCEACGTDFEVTTDKRSDAKFCSDKCKARSHYERTRLARGTAKGKKGKP